jgi:hypothetical protein
LKSCCAFPLILLIVLLFIVSTNVVSVNAVQYWHKDTETKGNWIEEVGDTWHKRYGNDGYILCAYDSQGHNDEMWKEAFDRKNLPPYITGYSVSGTGGTAPLQPGTAGVWTVAAPTSDGRALVDPDILDDPHVLENRKNTHWFTTPYESEDALLSVQLEFSPEACDKFFHLSLYFLDADQNRKLNVTVTDEDPSNPQSVSVVIEPDEAKGGVYLVFTVYGPTVLGIRLFADYNCNPCISGIFIDDASLPVPPHVIPEVPLGTVVAGVSMIAALVAYARPSVRKRRIHAT